jgi:antitoxin component HigA of HigAB toxin-antitoxin module
MIYSHDEHQAALARVKMIWDAEEGTPEFAELDRLADEIEAYEKIHFPIGGDEKFDAAIAALEEIVVFGKTHAGHGYSCARLAEKRLKEIRGEQ